MGVLHKSQQGSPLLFVCPHKTSLPGYPRSSDDAPSVSSDVDALQSSIKKQACSTTHSVQQAMQSETVATTLHDSITTAAASSTAAHHPHSTLHHDHLTSVKVVKQDEETNIMERQNHVVPLWPSVILGKRKAESLANDKLQLPYQKAGIHRDTASAKVPGKDTLAKIKGREISEAGLASNSNFKITGVPPVIAPRHTATFSPPDGNHVLLPGGPTPTGQTKHTIPASPPLPTLDPCTTPTYSSHLPGRIRSESHDIPKSTSNTPVIPVNPTTSSFPARPFVFIPKPPKKTDRSRTTLAKELANVTHSYVEGDAAASSSGTTLVDMEIDELEHDDGNTVEPGFVQKVQEWADAVANIHKMMLESDLFGDEPTHDPRKKLLHVLKEIDRQKNWITYDEERVTGLARRIIQVSRNCDPTEDAQSIKLAIRIVDNLWQRFEGRRFTWSAWLRTNE
ncbi:hypothetical protein BU15DRAFT_58016 [Melanogaster broomeanus]|nr:hypothetical protein BU15DRAFT_58016 [Melanogaster broomeanus]